MIVTFSTLFIAFLNSSHSLFMMLGQANGGDFDITVTALVEDQYYNLGHDNFYTDV